jgi:four helix bundle protein
VEASELEGKRRYDLQDRLIGFAISVCEIAESLPSTKVGKHVAGQLIRCGTSSAPNYGEAQSAEARKDFVHKLKVCLKELRETVVWLEFARRKEIGELAAIDAGLRESDELAAILYRSIETAERNDKLS